MDEKINTIQIKVTLFGKTEDGTNITLSPPGTFVSLEEALSFLVQFKTPPTN